MLVIAQLLGGSAITLGLLSLTGEISGSFGVLAFLLSIVGLALTVLDPR